ncbi:HSF-type DNA-binding [Seminavis robusta]|uniref:HSF-type DNA-binding n=1 Tax=Seminavis robusta TaxID=568900 RepID=A0A9N8EE61_9STRA|nr:HSF-type DNA-binding [Seminavis robusta]|eukprot:Sro993_g228910.1 HSF-type DNA-binding (556) ;mRNA; f:13453-15379
MNKRNSSMEDESSESNKRQLSQDIAGRVSPSGSGGAGSGSGSGRRKKSRTLTDQEGGFRAESKEATGDSSLNLSGTGGAYSSAAMSSALGMLQEAKTTIPATATATASAPATAPASGAAPNPSEEAGVTFPERLMELIMNETDKRALWWLPDGKTFAINSKQFTSTILAKKFQGSKFESFTRKLARWGFKRLSGADIPPQTFFFQHPYFLKDKPQLAKEISGSKKKITIASLEEKTSHQSPAPATSSLAQAAIMTVPAPAPWPTFADQPQHTQQQQQAQAQAQTQPPMGTGTGPGIDAPLYDALAGTGASRHLQQQPRNTTRSSNTNLAAATQLRQQDLEMQLLLRSVVNSFGESPRIPQRQEALQASHLFAEHDRTRRVLAATPSSNSFALAGLSNLTSPTSRAALSHTIPATLSNRASSSAADLSSSSNSTAAALNLPDLLPTSRNVTSNSNSRALAAAGLRVPNFLSENPASAAVLQSHQTHSSGTAADTGAGAADPAATSSSTSLELVRLYLQQQETNRQEALLMQRNELIRQELLRREQQRQNREGRGEP